MYDARSPIIKLALEGQDVAAFRRVDPHKYDDDIIDELHRRAIDMAMARQQQTCDQDEERDSSYMLQPSPDSFKVILKYKDTDGEECMIVSRDDVNDACSQYKTFTNVKVYAQVLPITLCKDDVRNDDCTRDDTAECRADAPEGEDSSIETSSTAEAQSASKNVAMPFRSVRKNLGLTGTRLTRKQGAVDQVATISTRRTLIGNTLFVKNPESSKRGKVKKKFSLRLARKRPSIQKETPKHAEDSDGRKNNPENSQSTQSVFPTKRSPIDLPRGLAKSADLAASTAAATVTGKNLQPMLFLQDGKAVTKLVHVEKEKDSMSLMQYAAGATPLPGIQDEKEKEPISLMQYAATGSLTRAMQYDRDSISITPPLLEQCPGCGASPLLALSLCCRDDLPALGAERPFRATPPRHSRALLDSTLPYEVTAALDDVVATKEVKDEMTSTDNNTTIELPPSGVTNGHASGPTLNLMNRRSRSAPTRSSSSTMFHDEIDMQKTIQHLLLMSNDLIANHTGMLIPSGSEHMGLGTIKEDDEDSNAFSTGTMSMEYDDFPRSAFSRIVSDVFATDWANGGSIFENYENDEDKHKSMLSADQGSNLGSSSSSSDDTQGSKNRSRSSSDYMLIPQRLSEVLFYNWRTSSILSIIKEDDHEEDDEGSCQSRKQLSTEEKEMDKGSSFPCPLDASKKLRSLKNERTSSFEAKAQEHLSSSEVNPNNIESNNHSTAPTDLDARSLSRTVADVLFPYWSNGAGDDKQERGEAVERLTFEQEKEYASASASVSETMTQITNDALSRSIESQDLCAQAFADLTLSIAAFGHAAVKREKQENVSIALEKTGNISTVPDSPRSAKDTATTTEEEVLSTLSNASQPFRAKKRDEIRCILTNTSSRSSIKEEVEILPTTSNSSHLSYTIKGDEIQSTLLSSSQRSALKSEDNDKIRPPLMTASYSSSDKKVDKMMLSTLSTTSRHSAATRTDETRTTMSNSSCRSNSGDKEDDMPSTQSISSSRRSSVKKEDSDARSTISNSSRRSSSKKVDKVLSSTNTSGHCTIKQDGNETKLALSNASRQLILKNDDDDDDDDDDEEKSILSTASRRSRRSVVRKGENGTRSTLSKIRKDNDSRSAKSRARRGSSPRRGSLSRESARSNPTPVALSNSPSVSDAMLATNEYYEMDSESFAAAILSTLSSATGLTAFKSGNDYKEVRKDNTTNSLGTKTVSRGEEDPVSDVGVDDNSTVVSADLDEIIDDISDSVADAILCNLPQFMKNEKEKTTNEIIKTEHDESPNDVVVIHPPSSTLSAGPLLRSHAIPLGRRIQASQSQEQGT